MTETDAHANDAYVNSLSNAISYARVGDNAPSLVKKVIKNEMWRYRIVKQTKQAAGFDTFRQFVEAPQPEGLNTTIDRLIALCRFAGDDEAAQIVAQAGEVALQENAERRKDLVIVDNLSMALTEALLALYVNSDSAPYRVPCAIQGDLWKFVTVDSPTAATDIIRSAVQRAAGRVA